MHRSGPALSLTLSIALGVVACGRPAASTSPEPSANTLPTALASPEATPSPVVTLEPTASAAAFASPTAVACPLVPYTGPWPAGPMLPGSAVRVAVAELNVRDQPCTAAERSATLEKGRLLIVSDQTYQPVRADGYAWQLVLFPPNAPNNELPVLPQRWFPADTDTSFGWIAVTNGSSAFVKPVAARCPTTVDVENVQAMLPAEWLACFHAPIVLQGTYGCGGCGGEGGPVSEPRWLADTFQFEQLHVRWSDGFQDISVPVHFKPDGPSRPKEGSIVRMTVHVDDPAAQTCSFTWNQEEPHFAVPRDFAVAWCRERFVVDAYEVIGTDPDYPDW